VPAWQAELNVRAYQLNNEGAADETEGDVTSCQIWMLPATVLEISFLAPRLSFSPNSFFSFACTRIVSRSRFRPLSSMCCVVPAKSCVPPLSCHAWSLFWQEFHGLWDTLVYDVEVKSHLLDYAQSAMYFADKRVDPNIVAWNRVVLLHGARLHMPPPFPCSFTFPPACSSS